MRDWFDNEDSGDLGMMGAADASEEIERLAEECSFCGIPIQDGTVCDDCFEDLLDPEDNPRLIGPRELELEQEAAQLGVIGGGQGRPVDARSTIIASYIVVVAVLAGLVALAWAAATSLGGE